MNGKKNRIKPHLFKLHSPTGSPCFHVDISTNRQGSQKVIEWVKPEFALIQTRKSKHVPFFAQGNSNIYCMCLTVLTESLRSGYNYCRFTEGEGGVQGTEHIVQGHTAERCQN